MIDSENTQNLFHAVFHENPNAMLIVDSDLNITAINRKMSLLTNNVTVGCPNWIEMIFRDEKSTFITLLEKSGSSQRPVQSQVIIRNTEKQQLTMNCIISRIGNGNTRLVSLLDFTEQTHKEELLEESRQRFKEIADLLPGIICEMDMSLRLTYCNELGLKTFGFTREEFEKGIYVNTLFPPEQQEIIEKDMYNIFHGDFGNPSEYKLYKKDRSIIHIIINSAPITKNGTIAGIRTCIVDISDRVLSEEKFRTVFAKSPTGLALFDSNGTICECNDSFKALFPDKRTVVELFGEIRSKEILGLQALNFEECKRNEKEEKRWYEWHISPLGTTREKPSMYLSQFQDITEKRLAEEARLLKEKEAVAKAYALVEDLRRELMDKATFNKMVSRSPQMKRIFEILPEVAQATATVLVQGESGTGKELIARSLHELSSRKDKPFIAINCSALPDNLLESELFGYKAGAFTDAKKDKPGKFSLADGGTIFLDEIGDISPAMQVKLLRVLQEKCFEPLGATFPVSVDIRIIAATNRKLPEMVKNGEFREDLFYRINVVTINLPPLRERRCDIPLLCDHFRDRFNARYGKAITAISERATELLLEHDFPGNIRELENIIEHAFIFCKESTIDVMHLPQNLQLERHPGANPVLSAIRSFEELEKMYILSILEETGGSKIKAAERLGIHKATLFRKLKQHGL